MDINDIEVFLEGLKGKIDTMETGISYYTLQAHHKQNQKENKSIKDIYGWEGQLFKMATIIRAINYTVWENDDLPIVIIIFS